LFAQFAWEGEERCSCGDGGFGRSRAWCSRSALLWWLSPGLGRRCVLCDGSAAKASRDDEIAVLIASVLSQVRSKYTYEEWVAFSSLLQLRR
jgi:hypothetical protein